MRKLCAPSSRAWPARGKQCLLRWCGLPDPLLWRHLQGLETGPECTKYQSDLLRNCSKITSLPLAPLKGRPDLAWSAPLSGAVRPPGPTQAAL